MPKLLLTATCLAAVLLSGCASQPSSSFEGFQSPDLNALLRSGQYVQKTDNFFVINDSSASMTEAYTGAGYRSSAVASKFAVAKEILKRINHTIPEIKLTTSIRSFGFGNCLDFKFTKLNLPPTAYSKETFNSGVDALTCGSGGSPLGDGINGTSEELSTSTGRTAVLIVSDGYELDSDGADQLEALKQRYGDKLCVYSVWVGNKEEAAGQTVLNHLTRTAACGYSVSAERISNPTLFSNFVKSIFLKVGSPVADCSSQDSDKDGVDDCHDKCPASLAGEPVSIRGCWIVDVKFDNDKDEIKPMYFPNLDNTAKAIKDNPGLVIEVQGHTSHTGDFKHNMELSERRANAVKNYLQKQSSSTKLSARGYGWTQPVDSNDTEDGRANNRRVQLQVDGAAQQPLK